MYEQDDESICMIEDDHNDIANETQPDPNKWQSFELTLQELDCASGVCWHPAAANKIASPRKPTVEQRLQAIRQDVASWFVQLDGKFIPATNKDSRLGTGEIEKILPQMLAERFPDNDLVERNAGVLAP